ncbi:ZIP family metal transporter [Thermoactinomyces mirandus]|uniref:ZIP family metal transporter n=1 Tax=Thermoactinomyces mirandus TaxID=2756294 RepID=A0A7W2AQB4_9BACL|nr:ZIP family metal transporter [Thermoactinomyces mirandus]MBA4601789.1 ZIP family metal transporter [Thermoactinomyces mirandus]
MAEWFVQSAIITLIGSGGFLLGAWIAARLREIPGLSFGWVYAISSGLLFGMIILELIPEAFAHFPVHFIFVGLILGLLFIRSMHWFLSRLIIFAPRYNWLSVESVSLLFIGISLHNLPIGISLGFQLNADGYFPIPWITALIFHHIPEGLALFSILITQGIRFAKTVLLSLLLSLSLGLGTILGFMADFSTSVMISLSMGMSIALLIYIAWFDMAMKARQVLSVRHLLIGFCSGSIVCSIIMSLTHVQ